MIYTEYFTYSHTWQIGNCSYRTAASANDCPDNLPIGGTWNMIPVSYANVHITYNLLDYQTGADSGVDYTFNEWSGTCTDTRFWNSLRGIVGFVEDASAAVGNDGIDSALDDTACQFGDAPRWLKFSQVPSGTYTVELISHTDFDFESGYVFDIKVNGSFGLNGAGDRHVPYQSGEVLTWTGVIPDAEGEITIDVINITGRAYIAAVRLLQTDAGGGGTDGNGQCDMTDVVDSDNDGVPDDCETDVDGDGVDDNNDNCPTNANADQADADGDSIGDACEADTDGDGFIDDLDNCPVVANPDQADSDSDGEGDACDEDIDGDGVLNVVDNCSLLYNPDQADSDGDGQGDECDGDDDADGVPDTADFCPGTPLDVAYDANGCSGTQYVELQAGACSDYPNHGQYMKAVAHAVNEARDAGLLTGREGGAIVRNEAKASCQ